MVVEQHGDRKGTMFIQEHVHTNFTTDFWKSFCNVMYKLLLPQSKYSLINFSFYVDNLVLIDLISSDKKMFALDYSSQFVHWVVKTTLYIRNLIGNFKRAAITAHKLSWYTLYACVRWCVTNESDCKWINCYKGLGISRDYVWFLFDYVLAFLFAKTNR